MSQAVKFSYDAKHIIFFVLYKGVRAEVMRASLPTDVSDLIRLRRIAQQKADDLLGALRRAA